ncbi:Hypothetical protein CINCED_3A023677 [Cinara cedri]|nr:Hypothetical protein CINCED_3A023677 [Cinara cedri]
MRCHSCNCSYHLNCMDPPIRDWDNGTRWICPAHNKFYELMYPDYFPPGSKTVSDKEVLKRLRCEVPPIQPVNSYFKIPNHIDAMYKKPEEKNIPTSNSLNILCDLASFELKSLNNSNLKINENISNDVTEKFLASQHYNQFQNINVLPKQPNAYLTCLTLPIEFLVKNEPITIGKSRSNHLCLEEYDNCQFISDHHATITFDEVIGDFLVKNHSVHGIIVDNISYYGHHRSDQKKILSYISKFLNNRRVAVRKDNLFQVYSYYDKKAVKYISGMHSFDYGSMYKYYNDETKESDYAYRLDPCKCLKRHIPNDGYTGQALLRDESLISIGCLQFKFTYNKNEVTKMCSEMSATKESVTAEDQSLNEPCLRMITEQDNCTSVLRGTETEIPVITLDDYESNTIIEQNHISTFNMDSSENIALASLSSDYDMPYTEWSSINNRSRTAQLCNTNDIIQVEEISDMEEDEETTEDGFICTVDYTETDNMEHNNGDIENWVIEEDDVLVNGIHYNINEPGPSSANLPMPPAVDLPVPDSNNEHYKTEHLHCTNTQTYSNVIVISSDDEEEYEHVENPKSEE